MDNQKFPVRSIELHQFTRAVEALLCKLGKATILVKKINRKIENKIVKALNGVCDELIYDTVGFCWLTHFVEYAHMAQSLRIVCVFDTDLALAKAKDEGLIQTIRNLVEAHLQKEGFFVQEVEKSVLFDTEENGADVNEKKWCKKHSY